MRKWDPVKLSNSLKVSQQRQRTGAWVGTQQCLTPESKHKTFHALLLCMCCWVHLLIHLFISISICMPGTLLGLRDTVVDRKVKKTPQLQSYILVGRLKQEKWMCVFCRHILTLPFGVTCAAKKNRIRKRGVVAILYSQGRSEKLHKITIFPPFWFNHYFLF